MLSFGGAGRGSKSIAPSTSNTAASATAAGASLAETTLATVTIPAGMMVGKGLNIFISVTATNNIANTRRWVLKLGGTVIGEFTTTAAINSAQTYVCDRGTGAQRSAWAGTAGTLTLTQNAYTAAIATSAATTLTVSVSQAASAVGDISTLEFYVVELIS